jgi:tetratricopeptide (TPR) repeat protein
VKNAIQIRLELVAGHWCLGEHDQALACLSRAIDTEPDEPRIGQLVTRLLAEVEQGAAGTEVREVLEHLKTRVASEAALAQPVEAGFALATPTMAELLEQQGHRERALQVAQDVLRRHPGDARALAVRDRLHPRPEAHEQQIAVLERWLDYFRHRRQGEARA